MCIIDWKVGRSRLGVIIVNVYFWCGEVVIRSV